MGETGLSRAALDLKHDIAKAVEDAVIKYLHANGKREKSPKSPLDKKALVIAAQAFRKAAEIPVPIKRPQPVEV
jgi:hypothetical protein